nr:nucleotidyltransferase domain-containing protein [Deferribacter desulfuricans]
MRLDEKEITIIKEIIKKYDPDAKILIFGSRADLSKKGGDIDILVISQKIDYKTKRNIRVELILALGERKIDIVFTDDVEKTEFIKYAYETGVEI